MLSGLYTFLLIIVVFIFLLLGVIGSFLPILPGPPLAWVGLLIGMFCKSSEYGLTVVLITACVALVITVIDMLLPTKMTSKFGGSRAGSLGATLGTIAGIFIPLPIIGIIVAPFVGAFIGELIHDSNDIKRAIECTWGSFLGWLMGTGLKLITVVAFIIVFIHYTNFSLIFSESEEAVESKTEIEQQSKEFQSRI